MGSCALLERLLWYAARGGWMFEDLRHVGRILSVRGRPAQRYGDSEWVPRRAHAGWCDAAVWTAITCNILAGKI